MPTSPIMINQGTSATGGPDIPSLRSNKRAPYRILVVDDDVSIRQLNTEVLIRFGYEVDEAVDGAAGLKALKTKHYDLVITDHLMPKVTGVEMIKMMRSQDSALPVIVTSGVISEAELKRQPWLDISAILLKPYDLAKLVKTVKAVLRTAAKLVE